MGITRYFRTVRHLRAGQVFGQMLVRLRHRDPGRMTAWATGQNWNLSGKVDRLELDPPVPPHAAAGLVSGRFRFIGMERGLGMPPDWNAPGAPRLWAYHLQYFEWLWSLLPEDRPDWDLARRLTLDWIGRHPPAAAACGWEPYPTSLRLVNWTLLFGVRHRERLGDDPEFRTALFGSIAHQTRWLAQNLETHIQANHLLENLAALACVAGVFDWDGCPAMRRRIVPRLARELDEQILPDGFHYERSPMYHARVWWLVGMLAMAGDEEVRRLAAPRLGPLRRALALMTHPDGEIALFNDAATGACTVAAEARPAAPGAWALPAAGYYGWRSSDGDYLVIDAAPVGPDHQPGHAHADFLSFELSLGGRRVITDTGVGGYESGAERAHDRSTAAHNTVEVEGGDSCEVWGCFRVGRRTRPVVAEWLPQANGLLLDASHHGYRHLPQRVTHTRRFELAPGRLAIRDRLAGDGRFVAVGRLHLAPGIEAEAQGDFVAVRGAGRPVALRITGPGRLVVSSSPYSPEFGVRIRRPVIEWHVVVADAAEWLTVLEW
jgi:uncharacterized heparinase superfamily protein